MAQFYEPDDPAEGHFNPFVVALRCSECGRHFSVNVREEPYPGPRPVCDTCAQIADVGRQMQREGIR